MRATSDAATEAARGTVERERHFLKVIRETLAARKLKPEEAAVVCGGFHLFLDRDDTAPPPAPPKGTVYTTVVPYSFFRVSEMAGYGAGNRAPQFYQTCFDLIADNRAGDIAMEHAIAVLRQMRKGGEPLSTADAIAVTHHAGMLARPARPRPRHSRRHRTTRSSPAAARATPPTREPSSGPRWTPPESAPRSAK